MTDLVFVLSLAVPLYVFGRMVRRLDEHRRGLRLDEEWRPDPSAGARHGFAGLGTGGWTPAGLVAMSTVPGAGLWPLDALPDTAAQAPAMTQAARTRAGPVGRE